MTLTQPKLWSRTSVTLITALSLLWGAGGLVQSIQRPAFAQAMPVDVIVTPSTVTESADPLHSPFPLPWAWVEQQQELAQKQNQVSHTSYTSDVFVSPDGVYQAQAELKLVANPDFSRNQLMSTLTVKNTQTQTVQQWESSSFIDPGLRQELSADQAGLIAVLWPVGWSATGEQLLIRQVQGIFSTDFVSDMAVIWSRSNPSLQAYWPQQANYDHAVLLGWSYEQAQHVLFRTETMGDSRFQIWAVDSQEETIATPTDYPQVFGQTLPASSQAQNSQP